MSGMYLYCQNTDCGAYLGSLGGDACQHCGWTNPEPQADALDATQILTRPAAAQKIPRDPIPTVDTWETCTIKEAKELNPALWRVRMLYPQEAIDAAIAAAKEKQ